MQNFFTLFLLRLKKKKKLKSEQCGCVRHQVTCFSHISDLKMRTMQ